MAYEIKRFGRNWSVHREDGSLVCVCLYKKGAESVCAELCPIKESESRTSLLALSLENAKLKQQLRAVSDALATTKGE